MFQPVELRLVLESEEDLALLAKICGRNISIAANISANTAERDKIAQFIGDIWRAIQ